MAFSKTWSDKKTQPKKAYELAKKKMTESDKNVLDDINGEKKEPQKDNNKDGGIQ
ncbi:MAG: hypothetical protein FWD23_17430 [Oscillospiraceae bacterium]|nr:hypothetical protein [Oscillospiraceae bacterium]